jgi:ferritin
MRKHAIEEMKHMNRLFNYVSETGAMPILGAEQHDEEILFKSISGEIELVGKDGHALFL